MTAGQTEAKELLAQAVEHHKAGRLADAEELYKRVLHVDPAAADAWYLLGAMADETGQSETALQYLDEALKLAPDNGQFHYSRGVALQNLDQLEAAAGAYRDTLRLRPGHVQAQENLAVALTDSGDADQAEAIFREVLKAVPDSAIAHSNLGTLLINRGKRERALKHFEHLLALNPADASARSKRYQVLLALGRFRDGYADYAWRHHSPDFNAGSPPQLMALPSLGNRDVDDRKLVILPEQGVGDEVLFAAGLPAVLAKARSVLLFADPRLQSLLQRSFPTLDVRPTEPANRCSWPTGIDASWLRLEAGDLPRIAFGDTFPEPAAYLRPDPQRIRYWQDRLAEHPGRHIGIAWRGGVDSRAQQARSISLADLAPLMGAPDASFINLQYAAPGHDLAAEIQAFNATRGQQPGIIELDGLDTRDDLDEMAALTMALDCVVTIDSAIAHLAAAVGARTCVLLPPGGDWRWFDARDDSAWYTNARVWRRSPGAGWEDTVSALSDWLGAINTGSTAALQVSAAPAEAPAIDTRSAAGAPASNGTTLLLNDTSAWYHWGCSCTSIALNEGLRSTQATVNSCALLQDLETDALPASVDAFSSAALFRRFRRHHGWLVDAIEAADRVVINGEGTLHGAGPQAVGLLYLASIAANRFNRPVQLVNHSVYPLDGHTADEKLAVAMYRTVYDSLQNVVVREPASKAVMDALGLPSTLGFDCLPIFAASHGPERKRDAGLSKHIVIAGSVYLTAARLALFEELINDLSKDGYRISLLLGARGYPANDDTLFAAAILAAGNGKLDVVLASSEFEWLQHIRDADLLVSGRFHHSIAATCMKTPFIVLGSNTPKIEGLMQILAEQSSDAENFQVTAENSRAMTAAIRNRLEAPAEFVLQDAALQRLRELASLNFSSL